MSLLQLAVIAVGLLIYLANVGIGVPFVFSPTLLLPVVLSTLALALAVVAVSLLVATKTEDVKTAQSVVPSADSDICDVVQPLEAAVAKGLASYYGLSGRQLEAALTCVRRIEPAVVENHYSLMYRRDEIDVLPLVQRLGLLYLAYSP